MQEASSLGAHELEELSSIFLRRIGCTPVTLSQPMKREQSREALAEQREMQLVSEPQRLVRTSDQFPSASRPKRFYRTFWRGIARRALAHYCEMKPL